VKRKKQDMGMKELFRHKLENAEIIPDAYVTAKLMHSLARREFVHFNPARFNIYYLAGILLAGAVAGILLFSDRESRNIINPGSISVGSEVTRNTSYIDIPAGQVVKHEKLEPGNKTPQFKGKLKSSGTVPDSVTFIVPTEEPRKKNIIAPVCIDDAYFKNGLFTGAKVDNKKLRDRFFNNDVLFETSSLAGCVPLKLHFTNKVINCDSCVWMFGDGGYSSKMNPDWLFDVEGEYHVVLKVFGPNGLQGTSSRLIKVYPKPRARFEITPERVVIPDDEIRFLNYSANAIKYNWDFGDGNTSELFEPRHKYSRFSNFNVQLVVSSEYGCKDSLTVMNPFSESEYFIDFPNAFIPNPEGPSGGFYSFKSDEVAQVFHPSYSGISNYQLKIFSKLGILIFESNDVNIGWDGYLKGQLSNPGVYVWKVRGNYRNGEPFIKMGDVILLKN
jgi:PKD repeat protein